MMMIAKMRRLARGIVNKSVHSFIKPACFTSSGDCQENGHDMDWGYGGTGIGIGIFVLSSFRSKP